MTKIAQLENWLHRKGDLQERLLTEARVLSDPQWAKDADWQAKTYDLINQYGQEKLRSEIKAVEKQLFTAPKHRSFQHRIRAIFKR